MDKLQAVTEDMLVRTKNDGFFTDPYIIVLKAITFYCQLSCRVALGWQTLLLEYLIIMSDSSWYLYLIRTRYGTLYTGITTDVQRRLNQHEFCKGARYLRSKGPLEVVYQVKLGDRGLALKAEYVVRTLPKRKKEALVQANPDAGMLLRVLRLGS